MSFQGYFHPKQIQLKEKCYCRTSVNKADLVCLSIMGVLLGETFGISFVLGFRRDFTFSRCCSLLSWLREMGRKLSAESKEAQAEAWLKKPNKPWNRYKEVAFIRLSSRYDKESCKNREKQENGRQNEKSWIEKVNKKAQNDKASALLILMAE